MYLGLNMSIQNAHTWLHFISSAVIVKLCTPKSITGLLKNTSWWKY